MQNAFFLEAFEARKMFSAVAAAAKDVQGIGPSSGLTPAAATPSFTSVHGTRHDSDGNLLPEDGTTGVDLDTAIKLTVEPGDNASVNAAQLYRSAVRITNTITHQVLDTNNDLSKVITSGGGDTIIITLKTHLAPNTNYTIELNPAGTDSNHVIENTNGVAFPDTKFDTFTTGTYVAKPTDGFTSKFTNEGAQSLAGNKSYTAVTMGPDGKLYAATSTGYIYAFLINSDGSLGTPSTINTIRTQFGGNRLITGIAFKPASTKDNMEMWVSSSQFRFGNDPNGSDDVQKNADNFTGEIDALSGTGLTKLQRLVIDIPRSVKDHTNNQIVFSPDGRSAYFGLAAMNAMGAPDSTWGNRPENIYSATIMQVRVGGTSGIYTYIGSAGGPVDLRLDNVANPSDPNDATGVNAAGQNVGTHYNIFKGSNPVRIWADGVRNDFDMVFATNGHLYAAINGSSAGGNTPATPTNLSTVPTQNRLDKGNGATPLPYTGPTAPALTNVNTVEEDALLDVKNGAYYGHPNPTRGEYIIDGANPTTAQDPFEFAGTGAAGSGGYATGQQPDRNYTQPVYDFGQDYSPDGVIQYKSVNGLDTDMDGYLMVARYSSGGDILALQPKSDGTIGKVQQNVTGLTNLNTPLDLTEDTKTGNIYVAVLTDETGRATSGTGSGSIVLLKPTTQSSTTGTPAATASTAKVSVYVTPGDTTGVTKSVTVQNTGTADMTLNIPATKITGVFRKNFVVSNLSSLPTTIAPGDSITFNVKGVLAADQAGTIAKGNLAIALNDPTLSQGYLIVHVYASDIGSSPASVASFGQTQIKSLVDQSSLVDQLATNA